MCDKEAEGYNCWNSWELLGNTSLEECLDDNDCDKFVKVKNSDLECPLELQTPTKYDKFVLKKCMPKGWAQHNADCWIDTALYSLFGNHDTSVIFSNILDSMYASDDPLWNNLAIAIRNFLQGIQRDDDEFTEWAPIPFENKPANKGQCKTKWKNEVRNSIINILVNYDPDFNGSQGGERFGEAMGLSPAEAFSQHIITESVGFMWPIYRVFQLFSPDVITAFITGSPSNSGESSGPIGGPLQCVKTHLQKKYLCDSKKTKFVTNIIKDTIKYDTTNNNVIILQLNYNKKDDLTRIVELRKFKNKNGVLYNLNSISLGGGTHYWLRIKCDGKWGWYNDSGGLSRPDRPATRVGTDTRTNTLMIPTIGQFTEVTAIYIKDTGRVQLFGGNNPYNKIINPKTGRSVNTNSKTGQQILNYYLKLLS